MVALTTFTGLSEPSDLARTSRTPARSSTDRMPPPAMMPVPGLAGRSITRAAPYSATIAWGIVRPRSGIGASAFLASSVPFRIASATSLALPKPTPTCPARSPTTTRALKLNLRPPLTTFEQRLISTTFSTISCWISVSATVMTLASR